LQHSGWIGLRQPKTITNGAKQCFVFQANSKMNSITALAGWAFGTISSDAIPLQGYSPHIFKQVNII